MINGQSYTWQRSVPRSMNFGKSTGTAALPKPVSEDPAARATYIQSVLNLSDAEFGDKLRMIVLDHDNEYLQDNAPDANTIATVRKEMAGSYVAGGSAPASSPLSAPLPGGIEARTSALLVDNRHGPFNNLAFPASSTILFHTDTTPPMPNMFDACSGSIIGPQSAMSAAHCFFDEPTKTWKSFQFGATGVDDLKEPNFPFGTFGCFTITFYSAFANDPNIVSVWDVAAFDFGGCPDNPGASGAGFLGYFQNFNPAGTNLTAVGYASGGGCDFNEVCGASGTATVSNTIIRSSNIFTKRGESGGPIFITNTLQVIGDITAGDSNTSYSRWFDTNAYNLFHSFDPNRFP
jgi:V8-like Glu-specific endopeptidase